MFPSYQNFVMTQSSTGKKDNSTSCSTYGQPDVLRAIPGQSEVSSNYANIQHAMNIPNNVDILNIQNVPRSNLGTPYTTAPNLTITNVGKITIQNRVFPITQQVRQCDVQKTLRVNNDTATMRNFNHPVHPSLCSRTTEKMKTKMHSETQKVDSVGSSTYLQNITQSDVSTQSHSQNNPPSILQQLLRNQHLLVTPICNVSQIKVSGTEVSKQKNVQSDSSRNIHEQGTVGITQKQVNPRTEHLEFTNDLPTAQRKSDSRSLNPQFVRHQITNDNLHNLHQPTIMNSHSKPDTGTSKMTNQLTNQSLNPHIMNECHIDQSIRSVSNRDTSDHRKNVTNKPSHGSFNLGSVNRWNTEQNFYHGSIGNSPHQGINNKERNNSNPRISNDQCARYPFTDQYFHNGSSGNSNSQMMEQPLANMHNRNSKSIPNQGTVGIPKGETRPRDLNQLLVNHSAPNQTIHDNRNNMILNHGSAYNLQHGQTPANPNLNFTHNSSNKQNVHYDMQITSRGNSVKQKLKSYLAISRNLHYEKMRTIPNEEDTRQSQSIRYLEEMEKQLMQYVCDTRNVHTSNTSSIPHQRTLSSQSAIDERILSGNRPEMSSYPWEQYNGHVIQSHLWNVPHAENRPVLNKQQVRMGNSDDNSYQWTDLQEKPDRSSSGIGKEYCTNVAKEKDILYRDFPNDPSVHFQSKPNDDAQQIHDVHAGISNYENISQSQYNVEDTFSDTQPMLDEWIPYTSVLNYMKIPESINDVQERAHTIEGNINGMQGDPSSGNSISPITRDFSTDRNVHDNRSACVTNQGTMSNSQGVPSSQKLVTQIVNDTSIQQNGHHDNTKKITSREIISSSQGVLSSQKPVTQIVNDALIQQNVHHDNTKRITSTKTISSSQGVPSSQEPVMQIANDISTQQNIHHDNTKRITSAKTISSSQGVPSSQEPVMQIVNDTSIQQNVHHDNTKRITSAKTISSSQRVPSSQEPIMQIVNDISIQRNVQHDNTKRITSLETISGAQGVPSSGKTISQTEHCIPTERNVQYDKTATIMNQVVMSNSEGVPNPGKAIPQTKNDLSTERNVHDDNNRKIYREPIIENLQWKPNSENALPQIINGVSTEWKTQYDNPTSITSKPNIKDSQAKHSCEKLIPYSMNNHIDCNITKNMPETDPANYSRDRSNSGNPMTNCMHDLTNEQNVLSVNVESNLNHGKSSDLKKDSESIKSTPQLDHGNFATRNVQSDYTITTPTQDIVQNSQMKYSSDNLVVPLAHNQFIHQEVDKTSIKCIPIREIIQHLANNKRSTEKHIPHIINDLCIDENIHDGSITASTRRKNPAANYSQNESNSDIRIAKSMHRLSDGQNVHNANIENTPNHETFSNFKQGFCSNKSTAQFEQDSFAKDNINNDDCMNIPSQGTIHNLQVKDSSAHQKVDKVNIECIPIKDIIQRLKNKRTTGNLASLPVDHEYTDQNFSEFSIENILNKGNINSNSQIESRSEILVTNSILHEKVCNASIGNIHKQKSVTDLKTESKSGNLFAVPKVQCHSFRNDLDEGKSNVMDYSPDLFIDQNVHGNNIENNINNGFIDDSRNQSPHENKNLEMTMRHDQAIPFESTDWTLRYYNNIGIQLPSNAQIISNNVNHMRNTDDSIQHNVVKFSSEEQSVLQQLVDSQWCKDSGVPQNAVKLEDNSQKFEKQPIVSGPNIQAAVADDEKYLGNEDVIFLTDFGNFDKNHTETKPLNSAYFDRERSIIECSHLMTGNNSPVDHKNTVHFERQEQAFVPITQNYKLETIACTESNDDIICLNDTIQATTDLPLKNNENFSNKDEAQKVAEVNNPSDNFTSPNNTIETREETSNVVSLHIQDSDTTDQIIVSNVRSCSLSEMENTDSDDDVICLGISTYYVTRNENKDLSNLDNNKKSLNDVEERKEHKSQTSKASYSCINQRQLSGCETEVTCSENNVYNSLLRNNIPERKTEIPPDVSQSIPDLQEQRQLVATDIQRSNLRGTEHFALENVVICLDDTVEIKEQHKFQTSESLNSSRNHIQSSGSETGSTCFDSKQSHYSNGAKHQNHIDKTEEEQYQNVSQTSEDSKNQKGTLNLESQKSKSSRPSVILEDSVNHDHPYFDNTDGTMSSEVQDTDWFSTDCFRRYGPLSLRNAFKAMPETFERFENQEHTVISENPNPDSCSKDHDKANCNISTEDELMPSAKSGKVRIEITDEEKADEIYKHRSSDIGESDEFTFTDKFTVKRSVVEHDVEVGKAKKDLNPVLERKTGEKCEDRSSDVGKTDKPMLTDRSIEKGSKVDNAVERQTEHRYHTRSSSLKKKSYESAYIEVDGVGGYENGSDDNSMLTARSRVQKSEVDKAVEKQTEHIYDTRNSSLKKKLYEAAYIRVDGVYVKLNDVMNDPRKTSNYPVFLVKKSEGQMFQKLTEQPITTGDMKEEGAIFRAMKDTSHSNIEKSKLKWTLKRSTDNPLHYTVVGSTKAINYVGNKKIRLNPATDQTKLKNNFQNCSQVECNTSSDDINELNSSDYYNNSKNSPDIPSNVDGSKLTNKLSPGEPGTVISTKLQRSLENPNHYIVATTEAANGAGVERIRLDQNATLKMKLRINFPKCSKAQSNSSGDEMTATDECDNLDIDYNSKDSPHIPSQVSAYEMTNEKKSEYQKNVASVDSKREPGNSTHNTVVNSAKAANEELYTSDYYHSSENTSHLSSEVGDYESTNSEYQESVASEKLKRSSKNHNQYSAVSSIEIANGVETQQIQLDQNATEEPKLETHFQDCRQVELFTLSDDIVVKDEFFYPDYYYNSKNSLDVSNCISENSRMCNDMTTTKNSKEHSIVDSTESEKRSEDPRHCLVFNKTEAVNDADIKKSRLDQKATEETKLKNNFQGCSQVESNSSSNVIDVKEELHHPDHLFSSTKFPKISNNDFTSSEMCNNMSSQVGESESRNQRNLQDQNIIASEKAKENVKNPDYYVSVNSTEAANDNKIKVTRICQKMTEETNVKNKIHDYSQKESNGLSGDIDVKEEFFYPDYYYNSRNSPHLPKYSCTSSQTNCNTSSHASDSELKTNDVSNDVEIEAQSREKPMEDTTDEIDIKDEYNYPDFYYKTIAGKDNSTAVAAETRTSKVDSHISKVRILQCEFCGKQFETRVDYTKHLMMHLDDTHYRCHICGKESMTKRSLKRHMPRHGEKHHECDTCGKKHYSRRDLLNHKKRHNVKPVKCHTCNKQFRSKESIRCHMLVHMSAKEKRAQKRAKCKVCGKRFLLQSSVDRHMVVHTGDKKFECDICGMKFTQWSSVVRHKFVVHDKDKKKKKVKRIS